MRVGDLAPSFTLDGVDGRSGETLRWSLDDHAGTPRVLVFYPADNSPVCRRQLGEYTDKIGDLERTGAVTVAISPQDLNSHREFVSAESGFGFPLLADVGKEVGRAYGLLGVMELYRRSIVVVGPEGRITFLHRAIGPGLTYRGVDDLVAAVQRSIGDDSGSTPG